jgi:hypothetical protein
MDLISTKTYSYQEISTLDEIRVLRLLPGLSSDILACEFQVVSLSDTPVFEALSYVWGSPQKGHKILCDGHFLSITASLNEALLHLRYEDKPRFLWVDAISINQEDYDEKGHQVTMMSQIYQSAQNVLIWLGPAKSDTELAVRAINQIVTHCLEKSSKTFDDINEIIRLDPMDILKTIIDYTLPTAISYDDSESWSAMRSFFDTSWFRRIWVVQEVCLGSHPVMLYGHEAPIKWGEFSLVRILSLLVDLIVAIT